MSSMAGVLTAKVLAHVPTPEGPQADLLLIEPNGDSTQVRCLAKESGTEIAGESDYIDYLNRRYGPQMVSLTARWATLMDAE